MSFFSELKRRKVYTVGTWYILFAFGVMEGLGLYADHAGLPKVVLDYTLFFLTFGFLLALFLAWAYEVTPDGVRRTRDAPEGQEPARGWRAELLLLGALVLVGALWLFVRAPDEAVDILQDAEAPLSNVEVTPTSAADEAAIQSATTPGSAASATLIADDISVAVLPFVNLSDITEQEHFADGLTEELLNSLAAIEEFRVISRTSCFAFKNSSLPLAEIADRLGVSHILEGSVRRKGNSLRITAQLIETESDSHLWSENFDRTLNVENVFQIQESIATTVIATLRRRLLPDSREDSDLPIHTLADFGFEKSLDLSLLSEDRHQPADLGALDDFNAGVSALRRVSTGEDDEALAGAVARFNSAMKADPEWGLPVAWLSHAYRLWSRDGQDPDKLELARQHAALALELDPNLAIARQTLAYLQWADGDFQAALDSLRKAESLGAVVHEDRGNTLMNMGRLDEAVAAFERAVSVDPLSPTTQANYAAALQCAGNHALVAASKDKLLGLEPESPAARTLLARSYARLGRGQEALSLVSDTSVPADILALAGEKNQAQRAIDDLEAHGEELVSAASAALILGETERGLALIEAHAATQSVRGATAWLFCEPEIRALAGNRRYDAILASHSL